jgi:subtilisin
MSRFIQVTRLLVVVATVMVTTLPAQGGARRVIVTLRSSNTEAALRAPGAPPVTGTELAQIASRLDRDLPSLREIGRAPFAGMLFAEVSAGDAVALAADPNVAMVEEDRLWSPADAVPSLSASNRWAALRPNGVARADDTPWGVARVTAPEVWAGGNTGAGVKVAVLDSGIDINHPDLTVVGGYNAVTRVAANYNDDLGLCNGHGTHIAGTIAAKANGIGVVGVAPSVQLYSIKVFEDIGGQCLAYTSNQIAGLNWAVTQGIRLVNVSIGGTNPSYSYSSAMNTAAAQGTYVIAAAGNNGGAMLYPGAAPEAIGIGALDSGNNRAGFSSNGPELDFAAPGVSITSTMPGGGYGGKSGTSMATPHVVGVAALILAANPSLTLDGLRTKLRDGALDLESPGLDNNTGWGLVRAQNSLGGSNPPPPPPPVPVTLSVSPASRSLSVVAGAVAAGSNASVTLAGDNAASTAWSAAKRKSWTTLTTANGTGNGTVAWSRSTAGLSAGTYVDTITVTVAGVTPRTVIDSLIITAAPVPLTLAVSPGSRSVSVVAGTAAAGSNATVTLAGDNAANTAWSAAKRKAWTTLTTASGSGSGSVAWSRSTSGLAAGTYVDTITVSVAGVTPRIVIDSLVITAAPVPLTLAVSPGSRSTSVVAGTAAGGSNAAVTLAGDNAASTAWSAAKRKAWTTLTTASGTGSGTLAWSRSTAGLSAGTYVDTITVSVAGVTPRIVIDSLVITAVPVPLTLAVSPASRNTSAQIGTSAQGDNATVTLGGDNAASTAWSAAKRKAWTTLTTANGTGNGTVSWSRSTSGLGVGTYVDTITVSAAGVASRSVIDTLVITAAPVPLTLAISPASRNASAQVGTSAPNDNAAVTLAGDNAANTAWSASKRKTWTTLTTANGTGNGTVSWSRSTSGLSVGTYVDTITVSAAGVASRSVIDTLVITAAPVPLTLAVSPASRTTSAQVGTGAQGDNAAVTLAGDNATSTAWSAAKRKAWTTLTTASGTGNGTVAWSRSTSGLGVGTYVDTITVSAAGVASRSVIDTLVITAAPVPLTLTVSPASRSVSVVAGTAAPGSNALVTLAGDNAGSTAWSAASRKSWTLLTTANGTGNGTIVWSRNSVGLAAGIYVDTITVTAAGTAGRTVIDSLVITAAAAPLTLTLAPASRSTVITQGNTAGSTNGSVTLAGSGASSTVWTATKRKSWTTLTTASGTGSGTVAWNRATTSLAVGTYVDTVTVTAGAVSARIIDSIVVVAPTTSRIAVKPKGKMMKLLTQAGGASSFAVVKDSALVEGEVVAGQSDVWTASTNGSRLAIISPIGQLNQHVVWERRSAGTTPGYYIDTVRVQLASALELEAIFVDTLHVVAVELPDVGVAVDELVRGGRLNEDQRTLLDRDGNRNGYFDLGDFLAWVDRNGIRLSPAQAAQLQSVPITPVNRPRPRD